MISIVGQKTRSFVVAAALLSFLVSPLAACAAEAMAPQADQMACCQAGHHDCGTALKPADCCDGKSAPEHQRFGASKTELIQRQVFTAVPSVHPVVTFRQPVAETARPDLVSVLQVDTGPPDCLAFTVLLI